MRIALIAGGAAVVVAIVIAVVLMFRGSNDSDVAEKWGLLGEWKLDCRTPTSPNNQAIEFVVRNGKLVLERSTGVAKDVITITSAVAKPDGSLETTEVSSSNPPMTRQIVRRKQGDGRFVVWSNRIAGSEQYTIKDGRFANGGAAAAITRCRAGSR
jgi:hypothetical protein